MILKKIFLILQKEDGDMVKRGVTIMVCLFLLSNCNPGDFCGSGKILDCKGACLNSSFIDSRLGDGICDENLNCSEFDYDGGDCSGTNSTSTTTIDEITTTTIDEATTTTIDEITTTTITDSTTTTISEYCSSYPDYPYECFDMWTFVGCCSTPKCCFDIYSGQLWCCEASELCGDEVGVCKSRPSVCPDSNSNSSLNGCYEQATDNPATFAFLIWFDGAHRFTEQETAWGNTVYSSGVYELCDTQLYLHHDDGTEEDFTLSFTSDGFTLDGTPHTYIGDNCP